MTKVIPSILSENIEDYKKFTNDFSKFSDTVHLDFMDGIYVPTKSPAVIEVLEAIQEINVKKNLHLMLSNPKSVLEELSQFKNIDTVYIHADVFDIDLLDHIYDFKIALVLNPENKVIDFKDIIVSIGKVMIMTVHPGRQGNDFLPEDLEKINEIRAMNFIGEIHIDGHVNKDTLGEIMKYKPDLINIGSAIQHSDKTEEVFNELKVLIEKYQ